MSLKPIFLRDPTRIVSFEYVTLDLVNYKELLKELIESNVIPQNQEKGLYKMLDSELESDNYLGQEIIKKYENTV